MGTFFGRRAVGVSIGVSVYSHSTLQKHGSWALACARKLKNVQPGRVLGRFRNTQHNINGMKVLMSVSTYCIITNTSPNGLQWLYYNIDRQRMPLYKGRIVFFLGTFRAQPVSFPKQRSFQPSFASSFHIHDFLASGGSGLTLSVGLTFGFSSEI